MNYELVIVDLDGTILNFNAGERKAFIKTIKELEQFILDLEKELREKLSFLNKEI